jgi:hypothetical protein
LALVAAGTLGLVPGTASTPAGAASIPRCPPECGTVASGDPFLVPFMVLNPGPGWLALPAASARPYADALRRNLVRRSGSALVNVASAQWVAVGGKYRLLDSLVSSDDLVATGLSNPVGNLQLLCSAAGGHPQGRLSHVAGIPGGVSALCGYPSGASAKGATVLSFQRGNVAALIQITSAVARPVDPSAASFAAQEQYETLPAGGVPVSDNGTDVPLVLLWVALVLLVVAGLVWWLRRRRQEGSGAWTALGQMVVRREWALGVGVVAVVGAMAFSMVDSSLLHGSGQWFTSDYGDLWRNWVDGQLVTHAGGLGHLYRLDPSLETAPTLQVFLAPVARLGAGLSFPNPSAVLYPSAYWLLGPLAFALMLLPLCAADAVMDRMVVHSAVKRVAVLATMAITLPSIALYGHPEDFVALGAVLYGLLAALDDRPTAVGWWLGVALAFQFLAFLAVPLALALLVRRPWARILVPLVGLPLLFLLVPLVTEPTATLSQLFHQRVFDDAGYISPSWRFDPGVAAFLRAAVALVAVPVGIVVARHLPRDVPRATNVVVWTVAVLFSLRVVEPELVPYFLAPALALAAVAAARARWIRLGAACALAVWLNWWLHVAVDARWSLWLLLAAQLAVLLWLAWPAPAPPEAPPIPPEGGRRGSSRRPAPAERPSKRPATAGASTA